MLMKISTLRQRRWLLIIGALCVILIYAFEPLRHSWWQLVFWIQKTQNTMNRDISQALQSVRHGGDWRAWFGICSLGFSYGVLHAIGPGHGKAVITTFLSTQPSGYRHAIALTLGGALVQGFAAIFWVAITIGALTWLIRDSLGQVIWAERLSDIILIVVGAYILWRSRSAAAHHCCHGHHHTPHSHHNSTSHTHLAEQEQSHAPSKATMLLTIFAIGMRPCSGAMLALAVSAAWDIWRAGIALTLAMSLGTACTVLSIALLTVYGRSHLALRQASVASYCNALPVV